MPQYLVVTDTPGIKKYVFGTDALAEIRGASALLDRLNRAETTRTLSQCLGQVGGRLEAPCTRTEAPASSWSKLMTTFEYVTPFRDYARSTGKRPAER